MPHDGPFQRLAADGQVELALGDREVEGVPAIEARGEVGDERAIDGVELDLLGRVNTLAGELAEEWSGVVVSIHRDPRRGLARLVKAGDIGRADVDPDLHRAG